MNVFLRLAISKDFFTNRPFTKAYDARILFVLSGTGELRFEDRTVPLKQNTLCYYPAGTKYYPLAASGEPLVFISLNFDFTKQHEDITEPMQPVDSDAFIEKNALMTHLEVPYPEFQAPLILEGASFLRENLLAIVRDFESGAPYAREKAAAALTYVLYTLLGHTPRGESALADRIVRYLSRNFATMKENEELSAELNYHTGYLNRVLKEAYGKTIHQYLNDLRLDRAAKLLLGTSLPVEVIAERCGFHNPKHFSTLFSKKFSDSPSRFRKAGKFI